MGWQQSQTRPNDSPPSALMAATLVLAGWFLLMVSQEMLIKILASPEVNSRLNWDRFCFRAHSLVCWLASLKMSLRLLLLLSRYSRIWLCDRIDGSPSGSTVPGILQARTLEWGAIAFSQNVTTLLILVSLLGCLRIYSWFLPEACDLRESEKASKCHNLFYNLVL